jgi:Reverse transcriptase (RNA-dependent DNA polymerase)
VNRNNPLDVFIKSLRHKNNDKGGPQGGCLSPILWCIVVDSLICQLAEEGLFVTGYADDLAIVVSVWRSSRMKLKNEVCRKINIRKQVDKVDKVLINNSRASIRTIIGLSTGHVCTKKYLKTIKKEDDDKCRFCRETALHWLKNCPMLQRKRVDFFGDDACLKTVSYKQLLK